VSVVRADDPGGLGICQRGWSPRIISAVAVPLALALWARVCRHHELDEQRRGGSRYLFLVLVGGCAPDPSRILLDGVPGSSGAGLCWVLHSRALHPGHAARACCVLLSVLRGALAPVAWGVLGAGVPVLFFSVFTWGDAAFWFRDTLQEPDDRVQSSRAPNAGTAFQLEILEGKTASSLIQVIPITVGRKLSGTTVTFGGWMWASTPVKTKSITLRAYNLGKSYNMDVAIDETPTFHAMDRYVAYQRYSPAGCLTGAKRSERHRRESVLRWPGAGGRGTTPRPGPELRWAGETGQWGGVSFVNYIRILRQNRIAAYPYWADAWGTGLSGAEAGCLWCCTFSWTTLPQADTGVAPWISAPVVLEVSWWGGVCLPGQ